MVHGVHPVPGGDCPRPPRGPTELPDHGHGFDRHGSGQRVFVGRGHIGCRGHGHVVCRTSPTSGEGRTHAVLGGPRRVPPNPQRVAHPRGSLGHQPRAHGPGRHAGCGRTGRRVWMLGAVPRRRWGGARLDRLDGRPRRPGRAERVRHRFDGLVGHEEPRPNGRGRRGWKHPALRCAHGLRGSSRGLLRRQGVVQAPLPWTHHRRVHRPPRQAGLAHGATDPGAAHSPGQGDVQHLHGPKSARGDGLDVRRLPRPSGAPRHFRTHPRVRPHTGHLVGGQRIAHRGEHVLLRHPQGACGRRPRRHEGVACPRRIEARQLALLPRRRTRGDFPARAHQPQRLCDAVLRPWREPRPRRGL